MDEVAQTEEIYAPQYAVLLAWRGEDEDIVSALRNQGRKHEQADRAQASTATARFGTLIHRGAAGVILYLNKFGL